MPLLEVIGFYFDELMGVFDWSSRSRTQRFQTVAAWALLVTLIVLGFIFFAGTSEVAKG